MNIHDLLNKMAAAEEDFLRAEFMAPVLPQGRVRVRIAGLVCTLRVAGNVSPGWAILKPLAMDQAQVVAKPSLRQIHDYLALFPAARLLLAAHNKDGWLALPAHRGDQRIKISQPVPVRLATSVELFQQIIARFDGGHFWFQEIDRRRNPAIAAYLRQALAGETPPEALHKPTLSAEERAAYQLNYQAWLAARRDQVELRLAEALAHAGGELASYIERDDAYTVTFKVDERTYRSTVAKDDLSLLTAGICLSGQDRHFDLHSLVGVIREGTERQHMVFVGADEDLDEETYWQVHPEDV